MNRYLVSVDGNFGYPGGEFNYHDIILETSLEAFVRESLMPYLENWIKEDETIEDLVENTIKESSFSFCNFGYGEELYIKIEEV